MVEKLLGVRLHEEDYPPWSEWLSFIQCKYSIVYFFIEVRVRSFVLT